VSVGVWCERRQPSLALINLGEAKSILPALETQALRECLSSLYLFAIIIVIIVLPPVDNSYVHGTTAARSGGVGDRGHNCVDSIWPDDPLVIDDGNAFIFCPQKDVQWVKQYPIDIGTMLCGLRLIAADGNGWHKCAITSGTDRIRKGLFH
jgi:hypothetical protein